MEQKTYYIGHGDVVRCGINAKDCVDMVTQSFKMKYESQLPPKISIHPKEEDFVNTMPCLLPGRFGRMAVKVVSRIVGAEPALSSTIQLFDSNSGQLLAVIDGDWITAMRTGAVAALSILTFKKSTAHVVGVMGLGNTARATVKCLIATWKGKPLTLRLLRYKDQAEKFAEQFKDEKNVVFQIVDDIESLVIDCDALVSCVTSANGLFVPDESILKPGFLLIPVHTRGFQNCDLTFDKIFGDDRGHVCGFKYFNQFNSFHEFSEVLLGKAPGRENDAERIICYNIGLGLHDALFASVIYDIIDKTNLPSLVIDKPKGKFWV
ncbi:MAG: ornithine cyclodeaminase [Muribaculaceae bacterium]|nr:ornithine cyclodeaminase [Muribaculaceae bacterium]